MVVVVVVVVVSSSLDRLEEMSNLSIAHGHRGVLKGGAVSQRELSKQASELPMV